MANLILYYSRKGQNYCRGSIRDLPKGNTEIVAEFIQKAVGGDLFEIDTVKPYSADYHTCTEEAREELRADARPALKKYLDSLGRGKRVNLKAFREKHRTFRSHKSAIPRDGAFGMLGDYQWAGPPKRAFIPRT